MVNYDMTRNYDHERILQIIPAPVGLYAVHTDNDGRRYERITIYALVETWRSHRPDEAAPKPDNESVTQVVRGLESDGADPTKRDNFLEYILEEEKE
jgi:hypothetical protein